MMPISPILNEPGLHMLVGVPGCGKSTVANYLVGEYGYWLIELDAIRASMIMERGDEWREIHEVSPGFAPILESQVWQVAYDALEHELRTGFPVVWDCTNVRADNRHTVRTYAKKYDTPITVYLIDTPWEVCVQRNEARIRKVPDEVMRNMKEWWDRNCSEEHLRREGFDTIIRITDTSDLGNQISI